MADLLSKIYKRNLFYQQINFKWRSYVYFRSLVTTLPCNAHWLSKTSVISALVLVYLLDFLLGCSTALLIQRYGLQAHITRGISVYTLTMLQWTQDLVTWLMGIPAGLKLNTPLGHFLGIRCLTILELWDIFYADFIATYLTSIVSVISLSSLFGVTVFLSVLHDFLKFLNLCLICFLVVTFRIFSLQISALKSLARLFMGKKWNVLRERVDSCHYDTSQLLLGTVLFTVLLFLLPTTGIYLAIFLLLRMLQFTVQFALRTAAVGVNKVTVHCWRLLHLSLEDAPITHLKITLGGRSEVRIVGVKWNGQLYSMEEIKDVILSYPSVKALDELRGEQGRKTNVELCSHPMLTWVGGLPLYPSP